MVRRRITKLMMWYIPVMYRLGIITVISAVISSVGMKIHNLLLLFYMIR